MLRTFILEENVLSKLRWKTGFDQNKPSYESIKYFNKATEQCGPFQPIILIELFFLFQVMFLLVLGMPTC